MQIKIDGNVGIQESICKGIEKAQEQNILISFEFEGIIIEIGRDSNPELILRDFLLTKSGSLPGRTKVCAYPPKETSDQGKKLLRELGFAYAY